MNEVIIYSTTNCKYCKDAKEFFKNHDIDYKEIDVGKELKEREKMVRISEQMGVPVITINGSVFVGFNESKLKAVFNIK